MAVKFYIDKRVDKNGDSAIRVSISIRASRFLTSTGFKINPARWDSIRQQARKGTANAANMQGNQINQGLSRIAEHFAEIENRCLVDNIVPTTDDIKAEFNKVFTRKSISNTESRDTFWKHYESFIQERSSSNQWTKATIQKFNTLRAHLEDWRRKITYDSFSEAGLSDWINALRRDCHMKNSTIGKQLGYLKWFLNWATAKGYNTLLDYKTFSPKLKTAAKKVIFLEWNELMRVYNFEIPKAGSIVTLTDCNGDKYKKTIEAEAGLRATRDIFCFCCFTSLRFSDAHNLRWSNIHGNSMTLTTIKTADTLTIELNKYAQSIIEKYPRSGKSDYVLPRISNQRMNDYVKDLCELCGINEMITQTYYIGQERIDETKPKFELIGTHTGRRTFICNALMLGIPAEIVMKWTGHSDYKAMKPYIDVSNAAKAQAMDKFNQL